jgi:hypothetical protein
MAFQASGSKSIDPDCPYPDPRSGGWRTQCAALRTPTAPASGNMSRRLYDCGEYLQLLKEIAPSASQVAVAIENSTCGGDFAAIAGGRAISCADGDRAIVPGDKRIEQAIAGLAQQPNGALLALSDTKYSGPPRPFIALPTNIVCLRSIRAAPTRGGCLMYYGILLSPRRLSIRLVALSRSQTICRYRH